MDEIYLDHAATTPVDPRVFEVMLPYFREEYGNANSVHHKGQSAKVAIEDARELVASLINAEPSEIIFTSGGTESDNAVINGTFTAAGGKNEIVTSPIEHHAVLHTVEGTKRLGGKPVYLRPSEEGIVTAGQVSDAITDHTALVTLMHINNELGSINPVKEISSVCQRKGVLFHSDTVQSAGKVPIDVKEIGLDFLSISAHKLYGPKGVGVMYVRNGAGWLPWMKGGAQERNRRGGTSNVAGIVGLAKALELSIQEMEEHRQRYLTLRKELMDGLNRRFDGLFQINGPENGGAPHIVNIGFIPPGNQSLDGEMLLLNLDIDGICVSSGSACTSGAVEPSHVLRGVGIDDRITNSSIRLSLGKGNTVQEIQYLLEKLDSTLNRMMKSEPGERQ